MTKALVMFSGGLDSILAVKALQNQGIDVEALSFTNPFSAGDADAEGSARMLGVPLHKIPLGKKYLEMIRKPKHGYGSGMNPCVDCKIFMLRETDKFAEKNGFDFLATGEVLGQRPFSQTRNFLATIEKEAGLEGKLLRPLSAKLLEPTEAEKNGLVDRKRLLDIRGRGRKIQMRLAKEFGIEKYPSPAGGCLLADKEFSARLRELFSLGDVSVKDLDYLKVGRHFWSGREKVIVGRNEQENNILEELFERDGYAKMQVSEFMGPVTVILSRKPGKKLVELAAGLTVRYSDAPKNRNVQLEITSKKKIKTIVAEAAFDEEIEKHRVFAGKKVN